MVKVMFRIDSVQFARPDQAVQQRSALTTMVRAEEQVVFTPQTDHPQSILRDVVIRFRPAVICVVRQRLPLVQGISERFRQF